MKTLEQIKPIVPKILLLVVGLLAQSCAQAHPFSAAVATDSEYTVGESLTSDPDPELEQLLDRAEARASDEGRKVLQKGRSMIQNGDVIKGSCWDYVDGVYTRAGYPSKGRKTIFAGKKAGPYADSNDLQPGDWLYFVNHSYGDVEHSGIFVEWTDFAEHEALILSYRGESSEVPGRYRVYDLSSVYNVIRPRQLN